MDCPKSLFVALALAGYSLGCASNNSQTTPPTPSQVTHKQEDGPKRQPKPSTCVASAEWLEAQAKEPGRTAAQQEHDYDMARRAYQQALGIDPKYQPALLGLARLYDQIHDHDRAVATFTKATKLFPREASIHMELARSHVRHNEWEPAIQESRSALEVDPEKREYVNMLGYTLARAGRYQECVECFQKVGGEAKAQYNLARILFALNLNAQCQEHLQIALQKDPQMDEARELLARVQGGGTGMATAGFEQP